MRITCIAVLLFSFGFAGGRGFAQEGRGEIDGRVLDPSGAVVAGAEVTATNGQTGTTAAAKTNQDGIYSIPYLPPGTYAVDVQSSGFKKLQRAGIEVRVNDRINLELHLEVGTSSETVEVTGAPPLLETNDVSLGQVVDKKRIDDLPLQAGNAEELVLTAPGVVNTTNLRARKTSFNSASSQVLSDGNSLYSNETTLDGVPDTFPSPSNGSSGPGTVPLVAFQPPQSAVGEFKIQTTGFDASLGHTPGAVINLVTNSGTNEYHGELHEWFSNSALDTPTFFQNAAGGIKPVYQDNRYGASIGGPVNIPKIYHGKDKTFFFYGWESNSWGKPVTTVGTVPTVAERGGDLSALLKLGSSYQIYNPFTTTALGNGHYSRSPFAGNIIPANLIDPVAMKIESYYALPNTAGTAANQNNYTQSIKDIFNYYVHVVRVDHNFSEKNRMFVRLDYDHYLETDPGFYNNISGGVNLTRINKGAAVDDVIVLSPSSILDLRYGLTQESAPEQRVSAGFNLASLGFSPALVSLFDPKTATFPNIYMNTKAETSSCTGACTGTFSGFGNFNNGDGNDTGIIHDFAGNFNTLHGSHNLHYGAEFRLYRSFVYNGGYDVSPGLQFLPTYTNGPLDNSPTAPIGQEFASFLLGIPSAGQVTRSASYADQNNYTAAYLQDDWKANKKLTISAGLRYEYESPVTERFNRAVRGFDYTDPNPIAAQALANYAQHPAPGLPASQFQVLGGLMFASPQNRNLWNQGPGNLLPRFGIAYQLDSKTVIRSGYGIFFDTIGVNRSPAIQTGFTATTPVIASYDNGVHYAANLENPFPNGIQPGGSPSGLTTNLGQALYVYPTYRNQPYAQRWTFDLERTLPGRFLLDAAYVGNKAIHLADARDINAVPNQYLSTTGTRDQATINYLTQTFPNPFYGINSVYPATIARADLLRPYPEFGDIYVNDNNGYSWYHALQVRAEKRFSDSYTMNVDYTWSKFMEANSFLNPGDTSLYRSISQYDRPQRIAITGIWSIPFGRGLHFGSNIPKPLDLAIGQWQLNAFIAQQSGPPLAFGDVIFTGANAGQINLPSNQRSVSEWFNTSLFVRFSSAQLAEDVRTFPKYFSNVRGPNQSSWDFSLFKVFAFTERVKLQFRAECYDAFNHPNFDSPNLTVTSSNFGVISSQGSPSRQFQAALKLTF
jgi:hypothetical protein